MDEQLAFVEFVVTRLQTARIPYMLTGSIAMAVYAAPRMTRDVDVVIECVPSDAQRLVELFEADCYIDPDAVRAAVASHGMFNIIHNDWVIKADLIIRKNEEYRRVEFDRRRRMDLAGFEASIVAPEDLILSKLVWSRESGSELQARDVRELVAAVPDLDWVYLMTWAQRLGVDEALVLARRT